jgi:hypothetical protein
MLRYVGQIRVHWLAATSRAITTDVLGPMASGHTAGISGLANETLYWFLLTVYYTYGYVSRLLYKS